MKTIFLTKNYAKLIFAGLALLMVANSAHSQTNKVRMAFIGNSITAGVYDYGKSDLQVSYATQFGLLMKEVYGDTLQIFNSGVSGRTLTKHGPSPIWNETVFKNALTWVPDICLIALGTNDSKPSLYNLVQNEFYNDYQAMIDEFRKVNPNVTFVLCLPPPIWDGHPYSKTDPHNDTLLLNYTIPLIDSVAKVNNLFVVDFHTPFVDSLNYFTDHLHPSIEGHKKMSKILFDKIIEEDFIRQVLNLKYSLEAPKAKFTADTISGDIDLLVSFTDNSTGNVTDWLWDFGDGTTSIEQNPSHSYAKEGSYTVSLKVTGSGGDDTETITDYITVTGSTANSPYKTDFRTFVYPNPSKVTCTVKIPADISGTVDISVFDTNGAAVLRLKNIKEKTYCLDVSGMAEGLYYTSILYADKVITDKMMVIK